MCDNACWSHKYDVLELYNSGNYMNKLLVHIHWYTGDKPAAGASQKDKQFSKWAWWRWQIQWNCIHTNKKTNVANNILKTFSNSYESDAKPTVFNRCEKQKAQNVRFCWNI